jgi:MSHA pilin protein MshA
MKKQSGFTLIELVIVIIILGILSATAIPKFLNLKGDASAAALKGVKGALEGAATITYSKAAIDGHEDGDKDAGYDVDGVAIVYGYPEATSAALSTAAGLDDGEWTISTRTAGGVYIYSADASSSVATETADNACNVTYEAATGDSRPIIAVNSDGC